MRQVPVAILGAAGYGGGELLRLLTTHPGARVAQVVSRHFAGRPVAAAHRQLLGLCDLVFQGQLDLESLAAEAGDGAGFIFSALPNGESGAALEKLLLGASQTVGAGASLGAAPRPPAGGVAAGAPWGEPGALGGIRVIDLSADLRIADPGEHARAHPEIPAFPELRAGARYGLVELNRGDLEGARLVANPGCFATALELALAPLVAAGLRGFVAAGGATGSSGSGALPSDTAHHPGRHSDFRAYKLGGHPHLAEVRQQFAAAAPDLRVSFVPHSAPLVRGIFVTLHAPRESFDGPLPDAGCLPEFYAGEPMIRVREDSPRVQDVAATNFCDLALARRSDHVVVCAALDNLGKGMAGQAVQSLNLMCGLPETTGLRSGSPAPI